MEQLDIVKFEQFVADCTVEELSSSGLVLLREKNPAAFDVMMDSYHQYNSGRIATSSRASMLMSKIDSAKKFTNLHELCSNSAMLTALFLHIAKEADSDSVAIRSSVSTDKLGCVQSETSIDTQTISQLYALNVDVVNVTFQRLFRDMLTGLARQTLLNSKNQQ